MCISAPITKTIIAAVIFYGSMASAQPLFMSLSNQWEGEATGVSADGQVVVGHALTAAPSDHEAFLWTASSGMKLLGNLTGIPSDRSTATATSSNGTVIVGASDVRSTASIEAFRWTQDAGMMGLGNGGISGNSSAAGVSADGSVVVGTSDTTIDSEGFRWTQQTGIVRFGYLGGLGSEAVGVSGDGSIVVGSVFGGDGCDHAFRWTQTTGRVWLGASQSALCNVAKAVSTDGSVIVGEFYGGTSPDQAFRWTQGTGIVGLGNRTGGTSSKALAVSADGSRIVGFDLNGIFGIHEAIIWDANHGIRLLRDVLINDFGLNLTGWQLTEARGVSADGMTIVGTGIQTDFGRLRPWIARLPEPATISSVLFAIVLFARRNRVTLQ